VSGLADMQTWTITLVSSSRAGFVGASSSTATSAATSSTSLAYERHISSNNSTQWPSSHGLALFSPDMSDVCAPMSATLSSRASLSSASSASACSRRGTLRRIVLAQATIVIHVQAKPGNLSYTTPISIYPLLPENKENSLASGEAAPLVGGNRRGGGRVEMEANKIKTVLGNYLRFSVTPALPKGLVLSPHDGAISGSPMQESYRRVYRVTAKNRVGQTSCNIVIQVQAEPSVPIYERALVLGARNKPVQPNEVVLSST